LRYGQAETAAPKTEFANEYGFLKLRYKRPGEATSNLISTPIARDEAYGELSRAPKETRWAVAVAGYGMSLRGDDYSESIDLSDVSKIARKATGRDKYGYRGEFLELMEILDALQD